jgi:hypothetical protein
MIDQQEYYKYGYYQVGDRITRSKVEAIDWCQPHNGWPTWHYHDEVFSSYNWQQEPKETIEQLYQARAKEIREKYDHVVLMYSGGYDSHNMLMAFLSQGIVPDELAFFYHSYSDETNVINIEWDAQTSHRLKAISAAWPMIKFRRIDMTEMLLAFISKHIDDVPYLSTNLAPNHALRSSFNHLVKDWFDLKNQGRTLRLLYGMDKPRLRYNGTNYIFNFYDTLRNGAIDKSEHDDQEWFYWSPSSTKICIKQSHIVKRFWQANRESWKELKCTHNKDLGWLFDRENKDVMRLIYPWCEGVFLSWKPANDFYGDRDLSVITANADITKKYLSMCQSVAKRIAPMYFNQGNVDKGYVGAISKDYIV